MAFKIPSPLSAVLCPHCQAAGLVVHEEHTLTCRYCTHTFTVTERLCAECEAINAPHAEVCGVCRTALYRACVACHEPVWNGHDICQHCGQPQNALNSVINRALQHRAGRQGYTPEEAAAIKAQEEADSQKRLAHFQELERQRLNDWRIAKARKDQNDQLLLVRLAVLVAALALGALVFVLLSGSG